MRNLSLVLCLLLMPSGLQLRAQQPELPTAQAEHEWLQKFVGHWTSIAKTVPQDNEPVMTSTGSMESERLGEFWLVNKLQGEMSGVRIKAIQTLGYDAKKKKYIGTWVDNMMNYLWKYEGEVDDSGTTLALVAEGPNFMSPGTTATFRDLYEFKSPDLISATSQILDGNDNWITFMTGEMRRKSAD